MDEKVVQELLYPLSVGKVTQYMPKDQWFRLLHILCWAWNITLSAGFFPEVSLPSHRNPLPHWTCLVLCHEALTGPLHVCPVATSGESSNADRALISTCRQTIDVLKNIIKNQQDRTKSLNSDYCVL